MKKNEKDTIYINTVCAARTAKLLGKERLLRMADAPGIDGAFDVLKESGLYGDILSSPGNYPEVLRCEEDGLDGFLREYAPDERILKFCLLKRDFHNAEVFVKSEFMQGTDNRLSLRDGFFKAEYLIAAIKSGGISLPPELFEAVTKSREALKSGLGGMTVGGIFTRQKYKCLLCIAGRTYLRDIVVKEIDGLNISVCLRSEDKLTAEKMIIPMGSLTEKQTDALLSHDKDRITKEFLFSPYKDIVIKSLESVKNGRPLIELEKKLAFIGAERMLAGRFKEPSGTKPFMLYYYRLENQIFALRIILTGKANGLEKEEIRRRISLSC